jgi:hypothetical protein
MFRVLIFFLFITLFSSCTLYSRVQKDETGDYVTRKGVRYSYFQIDKKNGYIFDNKGKKILLTTLDSIGPIKFFK